MKTIAKDNYNELYLVHCCVLSVFHWSLYKAEGEEWYDEQHGAKGVADCCAIVPVDYRGEYPNDDVITNKMSCNEENIQQSYIFLLG